MDSATIFSLDFANETGMTWTFCVYQELPESPGLESVSWKQTTVPRGGESGVQWEVQYLAAIANFRQVGGKGVYKASQKLPTKLGEKWTARFEHGVQQLFPDGTTTPGQLLISNNSLALANFAIGVDGDIALVKRDVFSGNSAQFVVKPKYFVALFNDLTQGQIISGNQIHGPLLVEFLGGQTKKEFVAKVEGETFIFMEVGSSTNVFKAPLAQVQDRIKSLQH